MPKESNNLRNKKSQTPKPYDVSNSSFVQRATSRVRDFLPQTWLSRWWTPTHNQEVDSPITRSNQDTIEEFRTSSTRSDSNAVNNSVEPLPSKRPKLHVNSPLHKTFHSSHLRTFETGNEDLSPVIAQDEPSTSTSKPHQFTYSPLPVASPSHLDKINAGDDCSESSESTSGCSSLLPQAQSTLNQRTNDLNASGHNRSILPNSSNLSSFYRSSGRRPTFNAATFSSPLRSCMQDHAGNSPFYNGSTMYGGASANNLSYMSPTRRLGPTVRPIQTKNKQVPLSSTAKKILDALEQFSTPILDAKRIPVTIGTKRKAEATTSKRYTELSVPTTTDLLRVKRRERLQKSTSDARQTSASSTYSNSALLYSKSPTSNTADVEYKPRETDASQSSSHKNTGKLRTNYKHRRHTAVVREETVTEVILPSVKLPIKSLPSIDFNISSHSSITEKGQPSDVSCFSFSDPLQDKITSNVSVTVPTVNFKFSEPLSETEKSDNNSNTKSVVNFNFVSPVKLKKQESVKSRKIVTGEVVTSKDYVVKPAAQLNTGSVLDVLLSKKNSADKIIKTADPHKNKELEGLWQCKKCHFKNAKNESACVSCRTKKSIKVNELIPTKNSTLICSRCSRNNTNSNQISCPDCVETQDVTQANEGFGDEFLKPIGSWDCSVCLLNNKSDARNCAACLTVKPVTDEKDNGPTIDSDSGKKITFVSGSWECKSCSSVNKAELIKCSVCDIARNSSNVKDTVSTKGFGDIFKKPTGSWECEACMVQNASDKNQCVACTTPKPGVKVPDSKVSANKFSFGIPKGMDDAPSGLKLSGSKSANPFESNTTPTFNFGVPNKNVTETFSGSLSKATPTFQFGVTNQSQPSSTATFSFGIPKNDDNKNGKSNDTVTQVMVTKSKNDVKSEVLNSVSTDNKSLEDKHVASNLVEPKNTVNLTTSNDFSTTKMSTTFFSPPAKSEPKKSVDEQNEKNPTSQNPFTTAQSVTSSTSVVTPSAPSSFLKFGSPEIVSSNDTKNKLTASQNAPVTFNLTNESKNRLNVLVKNAENKPKVCNDSKPSFSGFQSSVTTPVTTFSMTGVTSNEQKVSNSNAVNFDTKKSTLLPVGTKEQSLNSFVPQATTPLIFGSADTPTVQKTIPSIFGETNSSSVASFPSFGNTGGFPSAVVPENKSAAVFTFGATNKPPEQQQAVGFGFPAPVTNNNPSNSAFAFSPVTSRNAGFNFTPKTEPKAPVFSPNIPSFGSGSNATSSVFGTPQPQTASTFGEAAASSPLFAFGSGAQQTGNAVFGFGTPQNSAVPAPAASPAFVFGATPAVNPVPAFDPNARPTFNFTGGAQPSPFTATPSIAPAAAAPQRKIRKAVRRQTNRQN